MKKKCNIMAASSLIISLVIFVFTYVLYHYMGPDCAFVDVYQETPCKPFVTFLFGIWGVMFLFAAVICLMIGIIFM